MRVSRGGTRHRCLEERQWVLGGSEAGRRGQSAGKGWGCHKLILSTPPTGHIPV